jgi:hypothetical protein
MLNLGRPFDLRYPRGPGPTGLRPDLISGFFINAETAAGNRGDGIWAVLSVDGRKLQHPALGGHEGDARGTEESIRLGNNRSHLHCIGDNDHNCRSDSTAEGVG